MLFRSVPFGVSHVVRDGNWKLCWLETKDGDKNNGKPVALFNIKSDPQETKNLLDNAEYQELVKRLKNSLLIHLKEKFIPAERADKKRVYVLKFIICLVDDVPPMDAVTVGLIYTFPVHATLTK